MTDRIDETVFTTLEGFYASMRREEALAAGRIVHCINPFPAKPSSEHDRAQRVTFASMARARSVAQVLSPELQIQFAKVTDAEDISTPLIAFDLHYRIERDVTDLADFKIKRPLPIMMDVITAVPVEPEDIFVFTNVDIALVPGFYGFLHGVFARGADCAIVNRRTISGVYEDERDLPLMACEAGAPHPGFDCFAFRGRLRDSLLPYDSCVGIGGVMLPLVYQLLASADHPVVLLDAHATYHLGDDRHWKNDDFADYREHNGRERDRIFQALLADPARRERLLRRLSGAHEGWVFPKSLRVSAGLEDGARPGAGVRLVRRAKSLARRIIRR